MSVCCADPWTEDNKKSSQKKAWASAESLDELNDCCKVVVHERNMVIEEFGKPPKERDFTAIACEKFTMQGVPEPVRSEKGTGKYCCYVTN